MLSEHLKSKVSPRALEDNIIYFDNYRITVLADRLFRIEENRERRFLDGATLTVWFRDFEKQSFTYKKESDCVHLSTARATLTVHKSFCDSYIVIDGEKRPLTNDGNLLGTARTLDCFDGTACIRDGSTLTLDMGVCSTSGVAVLDDTATLCLSEDGEPIPSHGNERDIYVFAYGKDYRGAVRALYSICGSTPMLPRFALGNWWSRFHKYTDEEYLHIMSRFEENDIPMSVATIDMDWHYSSNVDEELKISASGKNTAERGCEIPEVASRLGWTGYTWNKRLFPDYKAFLDKLHQKNLRVSLNLHPRDGVRYFEEQYSDMAKAMGIDPSSERVVEFDIESTRFVNSYFDILHNPYERDGVDFWWIDWQQGTQSKSIGLDPLWALNHYHFLDLAKSRALPLIVSRYAGIGSHRYPVGFSGDTSISWATLALMPYFTATASNVGYTWWGHDIGGHHLGIKDDELYLRFLQFGVFSPMNRMHCTDSPMLTKEPWEYENGTGELAAKMLRLRHALIPFLYNCNYLTHTEGKPLIEPMYYDYPDAPEAYEFKNQYMLGGSLLVAPITRHSEHKGLTSVSLWIPEGTWTDIFTGDIYNSPKGGKTVLAVRSLDSIPVLARQGSVLPLSRDKGNSTKNPQKLEVKVFCGNGEYLLYEDSINEDNSLGGENASALTHFSVRETENACELSISTQGERAVIPEHRCIRLVFPNIVSHSPIDSPESLYRRDAVRVSVKKNGTEISASVDTFAEASVTIEDFDASAQYSVRIEYEKHSTAETVRRNAANRLLRTQCSFSTKRKLFEAINDQDKTLEALYNHINTSDLEEIDKKRLCETF